VGNMSPKFDVDWFGWFAVWLGVLAFLCFVIMVWTAS
jgi:hypothetical protein